jgi:MFS family permease
MIPELMSAFDVSVATLGNLSACYFYAYALAQIPVGILIDRYGSRWLLTFACLLVTVGSFVFSSTSNMAIAELCRVLIGFGSAFAFVGCLKLGGYWFPDHKFAFIVGLTNLLGVVGAMLGGNPTAKIIDTYGWRNFMFASGVIGLVIACALFLIIKEPKSLNPNKHSKKSKVDMLAKIIKVVKCRQTWLVAAFGGCMVAPIAAYAELWGVSFLIKSYHIDRPTAAEIITLTFIGIAIGGPTIGWISDHIRLRRLPMILGTVGALSCISSILYCNNLPLWALLALHVAFGFFTSSMLLCYSLSVEWVIPKIRATTIALTNSIIMIMGALLQSISGYMLDVTKNNYYLSFIPLIACYGLAVLCFWFIREGRKSC